MDGCCVDGGGENVGYGGVVWCNGVGWLRGGGDVGRPPLVNIGPVMSCHDSWEGAGSDGAAWYSVGWEWYMGHGTYASHWNEVSKI